jgi:hypothetical protein
MGKCKSCSKNGCYHVRLGCLLYYEPSEMKATTIWWSYTILYAATACGSADKNMAGNKLHKRSKETFN